MTRPSSSFDSEHPHASTISFLNPCFPHNIEAEQALLGALLLHNAVYRSLAGFLAEEHFYDPVHAKIFSVCAELIEAGKVADPTTLKHFFNHVPPIEPSLTVPQYLGRLAAHATTTMNAKDYGRAIRDLADRRAIINTCQQALIMARDLPAGFSPGELVEQTEGRLSSIGARGKDDTPSYIARCIQDVAPERIDWLWPKRIALGKLNLVAGEPGLGKSQLTIAMAATVTTGGFWPDGEKAPCGTAVFITCEDDASDTIRPRLEAAGAALQRVHILDWVKNQSAEQQHFNVGRDVPALVDLTRQRGDVRLVVIDPILAYMGAADSHKTADVRNALAPLQKFAAEFRIAVVLVSHLNKARDSSAMSRVGGSGAFVAVSRSAWLVARDPEDASKRQRILAPLKNNIGDDRTGFAFTVEAVQTSHGIDTSRIAFNAQPFAVDADSLLRSGGLDGQRPIDEACTFLRKSLSEGSKPANDIETAAKSVGISKRTLARARSKLKVKSRKQQTGWRWELPEDGHDEVR